MSRNTYLIFAGIIIVLVIAFVGLRDGDHDGHDADTSDLSGCTDDHGEGEIELSAEEILETGIETAVAGPGTIDVYVSLAGEITVNQDRMAHVVPRVGGVVTEVKMKLGDVVKTGQVIAVIESQGLADAKAGYLAAFERHQMAKLAFEREESLWKDKISSEQDYLNKKQALTEAGIAKRAAEQKLHAIGFDSEYLKKLANEPEQLLTRFEITAPFEGTIIEKHIVLGELVGTNAEIFTIADLSTVWVDLQVYSKDLNQINTGQTVIISTNSDIPDVSGTISYLGPIVGARSRTALARVVLANESGIFRPGLFVTGRVAVAQTKAKVVVLKEAIQTLEGKECVFTKDEHGFEPAIITTGLSSKTHVQVVSGLEPEQVYVSKGAFSLKAKIVTSTLDSHAGHGH